MAAERELQNQKWQNHRVGERARKAQLLDVVALDEKNKRLVLIHAKTNTHEVAKLRVDELLGNDND
jgi:hypothetical protein